MTKPISCSSCSSRSRRLLLPVKRRALTRREFAQLMLDQIGLGRTFETAPLDPPLGRGCNMQIMVGLQQLEAMRRSIASAGTGLHLPLEDRSRLANRLLESLDEDDGFKLSPEWNEELQLRVKGIDEGTARMIPGEEVAADVRARLEEIRNQRR